MEGCGRSKINPSNYFDERYLVWGQTRKVIIQIDYTQMPRAHNKNKKRVLRNFFLNILKSTHHI